MRIVGADARRAEHRDTLVDRCERVEAFDELARDPQDAPGVGACEVASFVAPRVQELLILGDGRAPVADGLVDENPRCPRAPTRALPRWWATSCREMTLLRALAEPLARLGLRFRRDRWIRLLPCRRSQCAPGLRRAGRLWGLRVFSGHAYGSNDRVRPRRAPKGSGDRYFRLLVQGGHTRGSSQKITVAARNSRLTRIVSQ
jgi:hypothetical protein